MTVTSVTKDVIKNWNLYTFMLAHASRRRHSSGAVETIDAIARELTGGGLRLTTRQTFQYHGILKKNVKPLIQGINKAFIDSIAACGDVNCNVLCNSNPVESSLHAQVYKDATSISTHLLPATQAYHEIWLDQEKVVDVKEEVEPIYGSTYLPRKFKIAVAVPPIMMLMLTETTSALLQLSKMVNSKVMMFLLAVVWDAAIARQAPIHKLPKT